MTTMPDVAGGWLRSLSGKGEREEAGERLYGAKFENYVPIR